MDAVPSPREELERKAVETLEDIEWRRQQGTLSGDAAAAAARAIYHVTSGLVDYSVTELVQAVEAQASPIMKRHFLERATGTSVVIGWNRTRQVFGIVKRQVGQDPKVNRIECGEEPPPEKIAKVVKALTAKGYIEI
jgi:hypothetical protein